MWKLSFEGLGRRFRELRERLPEKVPGSLRAVKLTRERIAARTRENHAQLHGHGTFTGVPGIDARPNQGNLNFCEPDSKRGHHGDTPLAQVPEERFITRPTSHFRSNAMMLVFAVSTLINGYLAVQVLQKQNSEEQAKNIATQVQDELAKQREKIIFTPSELETVQRTAQSTERVLESAKALQSRVAELEAEVARLQWLLDQWWKVNKSVKKATHAPQVSVGYSHEELEAYVVRKAAEFRIDGVSIHYDSGTSQVVFIDSNNLNERWEVFSRTLNARTASKAQIKEWIGTTWFQSMDEIAVRQGTFPQGTEGRVDVRPVPSVN